MSVSCKVNDCLKGLGQTVCCHFEQQACVLQGSETLQDGLCHKTVFVLHVHRSAHQHVSTENCLMYLKIFVLLLSGLYLRRFMALYASTIFSY